MNVKKKIKLLKKSIDKLIDKHEINLKNKKEQIALLSYPCKSGDIIKFKSHEERGLNECSKIIIEEYEGEVLSISHNHHISYIYNEYNMYCVAYEMCIEIYKAGNKKIASKKSISILNGIYIVNPYFPYGKNGDITNIEIIKKKRRGR
jgi:hypothetical protein